MNGNNNELKNDLFQNIFESINSKLIADFNFPAIDNSQFKCQKQNKK